MVVCYLVVPKHGHRFAKDTAAPVVLQAIEGTVMNVPPEKRTKEVNEAAHRGAAGLGGAAYEKKNAARLVCQKTTSCCPVGHRRTCLELLL